MEYMRYFEFDNNDGTYYYQMDNETMDFSAMEYYVDENGDKIYYYYPGDAEFGFYDPANFSMMDYYIDEEGFQVFYYKGEDAADSWVTWETLDPQSWPISTENTPVLRNESSTWRVLPPDDDAYWTSHNDDDWWDSLADSWTGLAYGAVDHSFYYSGVTEYHVSNDSYTILYNQSDDYSFSYSLKDLLEFYKPYIPFTPFQICYPTLAVLAFLCLLTNICNTIVYKRMGKLHDHFLFLCLSAMDILHMSLVLTFGLDLSTYHLIMRVEVHHMLRYITFLTLVFQNWTCGMTAYLATQRCICIAFPFKVKSLFSHKRNVAYVVSIFVLALITAMFSTGQVGYHRPGMWRPRFTTVTFFNLTSVQEGVARAVDYFVYIIFPITCIGINFFMTCFLIVNLYSASKRRKMLTSAQVGDPLEESQDASTADDKVLSKKEVKIVRLVLSISIVFFLTYTPTLMMRLLFLVKPNLILREPFQTMNDYLDMIDFSAKITNSGTNIFFYYILSSRYRMHLKMALLCRRS